MNELVNWETDSRSYTEYSRLRCGDGKYEQFRDVEEIMRFLSNV